MNKCFRPLGNKSSIQNSKYNFYYVKHHWDASLFILWITIILSLSSCSYFQKEKELKRNAVARVYDKYLYKKDLRGLVSAGTSKEDSIMVVKNYIDNWIRQNVILHKAESNLAEEDKNVEQQLNEYRNSLITYIYQSELIRQRLDTIVNDEEIEKYYKDNQRNFELKDNIIKAMFIRIKKDAPKLKKVREWYKSNDEKDRELLEEYCHQYAGDFNLDTETWMLFDDLLKKVPVKTYDKEEYLRNNRFIEITDTNDIYFVNIRGFMIKESLSPLSFEKENIRALIINKRKLKLVQEMEKAAYDQALKNNDLEIYAEEKNNIR